VSTFHSKNLVGGVLRAAQLQARSRTKPRHGLRDGQALVAKNKNAVEEASDHLLVGCRKLRRQQTQQGGDDDRADLKIVY
jgi:hypothetical protein